MSDLSSGKLINKRRGWILAVVTAVLITLMPFTAGTANAADPDPLGAPHATTLVVPDLNVAKAQLSAATGVAWRAESTLTENVEFNGNHATKQEITLKRVYSKSAHPFIELVQPVPRQGQSLAGTPWEVGFAKGYLTYRVHSVNATGDELADSGMSLIAEAGNKFQIYEGTNGVRVQVIRDNLAPGDNGLPYTSQAPIDFGSVNHVGFHFDSPASLPAVEANLADALNVSWRPHGSFPATPFEFPDGIHDITGEMTFTTSSSPFIELSTITPALHPFDATATFSPIHLAYSTDNVSAAAAQLEAAGFTLAAGFPPGDGILLGHFESLSTGIDIEVLFTLFAPQ